MIKPIRILHVLSDLGLGGAEAMVMNLYRHIDRDKAQFDFMVNVTEKAYFDDEVEQLGGHIYRVPRFKGYNLFQYIAAWNRFFDEHPEHVAVHGHLGRPAALYLAVAKKRGKFTIAHSHGTHSGGFKGITYALMAYPTRFIADWFFACGLQAGKSRYGAKIVNSNRFQQVPNAFEVEKFNFNREVRKVYREQLGLEAHNFTIGHIGRLDPLKNHTFILKLFNHILSLNPKARLVLVGEGEEREHIERIIKKFKLEGSVRMLGFRSDASNLLQAFDVFILPSHSEGLPISLIEAQCTGLPCIASQNVTSEVRITDLVEFIPLKESLATWSHAILAHMNLKGRKSHTKDLIENGYEIISSTKKIQEFYLSI